MALQTDPDSYLAVYLALIPVTFQFVLDWYFEGTPLPWTLTTETFPIFNYVEWDTLLIILLTLGLVFMIFLKNVLQ